MGMGKSLLYAVCSASHSLLMDYMVLYVLGGAEEGLLHLRPVSQPGGQPSCQPPTL